MKNWLVGVALVLALTTQSRVGAQPAGETRRDPKRMEELRQRIEQVKYDRLRRVLALDSVTEQRFFAVYQPAEKELQAILRQRNDALRGLMQLINGAKTDADVDPQIQLIRDLNHKLEDRLLKLNDELKTVISPRQRARLLVFEEEFNRRIRDEVMKRRTGLRGPAGNREEMRKQLQDGWNGAPESNDPDDDLLR